MSKTKNKFTRMTGEKLEIIGDIIGAISIFLIGVLFLFFGYGMGF